MSNMTFWHCYTTSGRPDLTMEPAIFLPNLNSKRIMKHKTVKVQLENCCGQKEIVNNKMYTIKKKIGGQLKL